MHNSTTPGGMGEDALHREVLRLQQENDVLRYDSAVRRLFAQMPGNTLTTKGIARDTGLVFRGTQFFAAELEDDPRFPSVAPPDEANTSPSQRYASLRNLVLSVLGRSHPTAACNQNGRLLCAVNWQGSGSNWHGEFLALVTELNDLLWARLGFRFQCTVSAMGTGENALHQAAKELDQARGYRALMGGLPGEVLFYDGILHTTGLDEREDCIATRDAQRVQQLRQTLLRGDGAQAKALVHSMLEDDFISSRPGVQFAQLRVFSVMDSILKSLEYAAEELGIREQWMKEDAPRRLLSAKGVWALETETGILLERFQCLAEEQGRLQRLPLLLRSYIREHYADPNLNVNQAADHFEVTSTYATRVFKQAFDCGVLGYIQEVRLEKARELLQGGCSVKETAKLTGFATPATLIRLFKKRQGVTPARYGTGRSGDGDAERKGAE